MIRISPFSPTGVSCYPTCIEGRGLFRRGFSCRYMKLTTPPGLESINPYPHAHTCLPDFLIKHDYFHLLPTCSRYSDWLQAGRPRARSSSPGRQELSLHVVQIGPGAHPASYPMGTGGSFPGGKAPGARS
jgi:hypothetical protein